MVAEAKLKPCPFCGGKCSDPERQIRRPGISKRPSWKIGCGAMFCFEMYRKSKKEAILAWNTRFPPPNQPGFDEMYEALKRILTDESEPCERCCGNGKLSRGPRYNDRTLACSQCDGKGRIFADFKEIARAALAKADGKQAQS